MAKKLKILFVSSECEPFARTGGLGDVSAALPKALFDENVSVIRVMPLYRSVKSGLKYKTNFPVQMGDSYQSCIVKYDPSEKEVPTYFVSNDWYFNRDKMYGYYEDGERFLFFCKAVVEMLKHISFKPDIVHCNDWHTAFIPLLLKAEDSDIKTMYTIHSLKYSGVINADYLKEYNISTDSLEKLGYPGNLNFIKAGILYSDFITTVSMEYAKEITTAEYGEGMEDLILKRKDYLQGILNGIDTDTFNPANAMVPYDMSNLEGKKENKKLLRKELGLDDEDVPLISAITRLDDQKGIDIILNAIRKIDIEGFQLVILGTGQKHYEDAFCEMASMYPGKMAAKILFDTELSKRVYAGSDIFIMPSKFEPGGLGQLYAMAYGTVPVVRSVGGLKDTVEDAGYDAKNANGFCFESYSVNAFIGALRRAIDSYNKPGWQKLMRNGMASDKSWGKSVKQYIELYKRVISSN